MKPKALLVTTTVFPFAAQLARSLAAAGFIVHALCPSRHSLFRTKAVAALDDFQPWRPVAAFQRALAAWTPDIVIPCDDHAVVILQRLHACCSGDMAALIESSLGPSAAFDIAASKSRLVLLAASLGLPVPTTRMIADEPALRDALAGVRFPTVLKSDSTWGGLGVRVLHTGTEGPRAWAEMACRPGVAHTVKAMLRTLGLRPLRDWATFRAPAVTLQDFIHGRPANRAVLCHKGEVLAGISVEVLETMSANGPATVVRLVDRPDMAQTAARLVGHLGLSGFHGFDFVLDAATGQALLIEMNPRATPICHFALPDGTSLAGALYTRITGRAPEQRGRVIPSDTIALFPSGVIRPAQEGWQGSIFPDVPWDEPDLVLACLKNALTPSWISQVRNVAGRCLPVRTTQSGRIPPG